MREAGCRHCGLPLPGGDDPVVREGFCCRGCRAVHTLLEGEGLTRFYDLRGKLGQPAQLPDAEAPRDWLTPLEETAASGGRLGLDVQGLHCAGCVWVIDELFRRRAKAAGGAGSAELSPALGRAELLVPPGFDLPAFVSDVESLGYRLGPATGDGRSASDGLLLRTGICLALAGNGMFYAAAIYFGLEDGPIRLLLDRMSYGAALLAVLVGGPVFFRAAWSGLRRGVLHLDVPIAVGILLAFAGASWSFFFGAGRAAYLDTVTVFVALMLLGRWTQERVLERNRRQLLEDGGAGSLRARRVEGARGQERVRLVRADAIRAGDVLYLARGDLVPVDGRLLASPGDVGDAAAFSTDWIDGEAEPRVYAAGDLVPAGAFQVGRLAQRIEAATDFADSAVVRLLRAPKVATDAHAWWHRVASFWVVGVLGAAGLGFALAWDPANPEAALDVATAVLVVTCPCAFGIATPLAYELAMARLRRRGLFVRTRAFLDRVRDLDRIVFDKTGTLTTGRLRVADTAPLDALSEAERATLATLAGATSHPKSAALLRALEDRGDAVRPSPDAVGECPGRGVSLVDGVGRTHRLGAPAWVGPDVPGDTDLAYAVDGALRTALRTEEPLRPDAREALALLAEDHELWVLSGDAPARVRAMAAAVGIPAARALGGRDPEAKAAFLAAHDPARTMMIGDGLNDSLAASEAGVSGTPAIDRPFLASKCDFYFTTPGLGPIADALATAARLHTVVRRVLVFAIAYNLGAVALAYAGHMEPWIAALLMPLSSLGTVAGVLLALGLHRAEPRRTRTPAASPALA